MFAECRTFKKVLCFFMVFAALFLFVSLPFQSYSATNDDTLAMPSDFPGYSLDDLRKLADLIQRTGVSVDRIPALDRPQFLSISDASLSMENSEIVFVIHYPDNLVRIYPRRILLWHEAVNDVLPDLVRGLPSSLRQAAS